jgi:signal transduction histidine kinase
VRVLICDDAAALRRELRIGLEAEGFHVVGEAADGVEAEQIADELQPEAFVVDLSMPRRDGLELLPILRSRFPAARIVVFSGFEAGRMSSAALRLGADAYLEKGCPFDELVEALSGPAYARKNGHAPSGERPHGLLDSVTEVHERELTRISGRIHDGPVQVLTASSLLLRGAARDPERAQKVASEVAGHIDDTILELRQMMSRLASWDLGGGEFEESIRGLAEHACRDDGPECGVEVADLSAVPSGHCAIVFRTVQEAVSNVIRHAAAQNLRVAVRHGDGAVVATIADDGCGFDPSLPPAPGHFGLQLMRRRVESAGGSLAISSRVGRGTEVAARLPLH